MDVDNRQHTWSGNDFAILGLLAAAAIVLGSPGLFTAGLDWSDAPLHTFDGIFILEFVRAWPLDHARDWAEQFYLRHPALGIGVYYPPGFALIEAAVFAIFGVSIAAARATVLAFAAGALALLYDLGRRWFGRASGLFAALLLVTMPHGVAWLRDVMLEWPATFWILAALAAYDRDRQQPRARWALATWAAVVMAFLTKQTAGFIGPVIVLHAHLQPSRAAYWRRAGAAGGMLFAAAVIAVYVTLTKQVAALPSRLLSPEIDLAFYPRHLPEIVGWPLVPLLVPAVAALCIRIRRGPPLLILLAAVAWFAFSSVIEAKEARYFFFALPFLSLALASLLPIELGSTSRERRRADASTSPERQRAGGTARDRSSEPDFANRGNRLSAGWSRVGIALISILTIAQTSIALRQPDRSLPRYAAAVDFLAGRPDGDLVLIDAVRDGQFIFDLYDRPDTRDRIIPIRASKLLYARAAREKYDYRQFVDSPADVVALLDRYGIRYLVIESALPHTSYTDADPPPRRMLRELLAGDARFRRVGSWPLRCGDPAWDAVELQVYEYPACPPRASDTLTFSMPSMGRDVTLRLPPRPTGN